MNSTVEALEGNKVKLSISVDEGEFDQDIADAFKRIAKEVRIDGFRPGKAPRKILEARIGTAPAREEALREGLPKYYVDAIKEHEVDVIAQPEIDITEGRDDGPVVFEAVVEVRPVVTVDGYQSLTVTLERPEPSDDEIQDQIDRLRGFDSSLEPVDRAIQDGDNVTIDIKGTLDGEEQSGLTADDYVYEVGHATIVPELDTELVGAKAGDTLSFAATHPDEDEERELGFEVVVKEVKEKVLPELTDEWVADQSEFSTVDELKNDLRTRMSTVRRAQGEMRLREEVSKALGELVADELPDALVSSEMQGRLEDFAMRLSAQGLRLEQFLATSGISQEDFIADLRSTAATSAKVDLALRAIAIAEGLQSTTEEIDDEVEAAATQLGEKVEKVRQQFERSGSLPAVRSDIEKRKALDWVLDHVAIVDGEGATIDRSEFEVDEHAGHDHGDHDHEHDHPHEHSEEEE